MGLCSGGPGDASLSPSAQSAAASVGAGVGVAGRPISSSNPLYVRGRSVDGGKVGEGLSSANPLRPSSVATGGESPQAGSSKRRREHPSTGSTLGPSASSKRLGVGPSMQNRDGDDGSEMAASAVPMSEEDLPADRKWLFHGPYTGAETVQRSVISDLFQGLLCSRVRCRCVCAGLLCECAS